MTTRTAVLAALAVLLALPASAQPAHDTALVDAVLEAAEIETFVDAMTGGISQDLPDSAEEMFGSSAIEDTLRARLLADGRTAELREILAFLESPAHQALAERNRRVLARADEHGYISGLVQRGQDSKKGTLADEALVRRLVRAQGMRERMPEMMRRLLVAVSEAIPETAARLESRGGLDVLMENFEFTLDQMEDFRVAAVRAAYVGLPDQTLTEASEFYESPAGRYLGDVTAETALDVMVPALAEYMVETRFRSAERMTECVEQVDGECAQEIGLDDVELAPGDRSLVEPEVYEVAEVQPELVGGMEALQRAVVYPESARAEGVEGRVLVQFIVDEQGAVTEPEVIDSPDPRLDEAALDAVRQLRFIPGSRHGQPVRVRFTVPVMFQLTDGEPEGDP